MQTKSWQGFTQIKGIVMQTKSWQGFTQTKGIVMQTKSWWGFMQTKILSVVLDQGRQKGLRYKKGIYANQTDIHENWTLGLYGIAQENGRKKENCEKTDKEQKMDIYDTDRQGLIKPAHPSTSHFTPFRAVGQPTLPLAIRLSPPTPFRTSPTETWRSNLAPNRGHFRNLKRMGLHSACSSHASDTGSNRQRQWQGDHKGAV